MIHRFFVFALLCVATIAAAQPRSAIGAAQNTAKTANARNEAVASQQQAATSNSKVARPDSAKSAAAGAQPAAAGAAQQPAPATAQVATQRTMPTITREVFQYDGGGRRDPFLSLSRTGALRPHISELVLKVVMVGDRTGGVATIIDSTTKDRYQVKVGDLLGRYRVVSIDKKSVTFAIEEFGYSRQEKLAIGDTSKVRNQ